MKWSAGSGEINGQTWEFEIGYPVRLEWCNSESVLRGRRSGWGFWARMEAKVSVEDSGAIQTPMSNVGANSFNSLVYYSVVNTGTDPKRDQWILKKEQSTSHSSGGCAWTLIELLTSDRNVYTHNHIVAFRNGSTCFREERNVGCVYVGRTIGRKANTIMGNWI